ARARGELAPELARVEDLAAASLDFAELGLAVEEELDLAVPEHVLDGVRTYGELVEAAVALARAGLAAHAAAVPRPARGAEGPLERTGLLTPYLAEPLADDVLRSGPGARIEVMVAAPAKHDALRHVRDAFFSLARPARHG